MKPIYSILYGLLGLTLFFSAGSLHAQNNYVQVSDANGNLLRYYCNTTTGQASFIGVAQYAVDDGTASVVIADEVTAAGGQVFPVTEVRASACESHSKLEQLTLGSNIRVLGKESFYGCRNLKKVVLNSQLDTIASNAFQDCKVLKDIQLEQATKLRFIGNYAFNNSSIMQVIMPPMVKTIGMLAFSNCKNLRQVKMNDALSYMGSKAFQSCDSLKTVEFGNGLRTITSEAFYSCKVLTNVKNLERITRVESNAFKFATSVQELTFGDSLQYVDMYAFSYCSNLHTLTFGRGLKNIGNYSLSQCFSLQKIILPGSICPFGQYFSFPKTGINLYVPLEMVAVYQGKNNIRGQNIIALGMPVTFDVTTTAGGELQTKVEALGLATNVMELTVSGPINGTDIDYIHGKLRVLQKLDLQQAQIVGGGDSYHMWGFTSSGIPAKYPNYSFNTEPNVVGDYMFYNMPQLRSLKLPAGAIKIASYAVSRVGLTESIDIPADVEEIGEGAFSGCGSLPGVVLNPTLKEIGKGAFTSCISLAGIDIPNSVNSIGQEAFSKCENLQNVKLPDALKVINRETFEHCKNLERVTLPSRLEVLENRAFSNCGNLSSPITIPGTVTNICFYAFENCVKIPELIIEEGVEQISQGAFMACRLLTKVTLPSTLKTIEQEAFYKCSHLTDISIPEGLSTLGDEVFFSCDSLRSITLPASITEIPKGTFLGCKKLETVNLSSELTTIGTDAFIYCENLKSFDFSAYPKLTTLQKDCFSQTGLQRVELPDQINTIEIGVFGKCSKLEHINVPTALTAVPDYFVYKCPVLTEVVMHAGIKTIGRNAFSDCIELEHIDLPNGISEISSGAFLHCKKLQITELPLGLTNIGSYAFSGTSALDSISIPRGVQILGPGAFEESGVRIVELPEGIKTFYDRVFNKCQRLTKVVWPADQKEIPSKTFYQCDTLSTFDIPLGVTEIKSSAFAECKNLYSVSFPETLKKIGWRSFENCGLKEVEIPDSVTEVGNEAFANNKSLRKAFMGRNIVYKNGAKFNFFSQCDSLQLLRIFVSKPIPMSEYDASTCMSYRKKCVLEVPSGCDSIYRATDVWKDFKEIRGVTVGGDTLAAVDFALLKMIYDRLDGRNWTNQWDLSSPDRFEGKWYGVTTKGDHITEIVLYNTELRGEIFAELFTLPTLTRLELTNGELRGSINKVLEGKEQNVSPVLKTIALSCNQLTGDLSPFANSFPALEKLYVDYNQLTAISVPIHSSVRELDYSWQFIDPSTQTPVVSDSCPVVQVALGTPFEPIISTLQTYDHEKQDYSRDNFRKNKIYHYTILDENEPVLMVNPSAFIYDSSIDKFKVGSDQFAKVPRNTPQPFCCTGSPYVPFYFSLDWIDGDVNMDRNVDLIDLQSLIYYCAHESSSSQFPFNYMTGDTNEDKEIDVRDAVVTINRILDWKGEEPHPSRPYFAAPTMARNVVAVEGNTLRLVNAEEVAGIQLSLQGVSSDELRKASAVSGMKMACRQTKEGLRVLLYSFSGQTLQPGQHDLFVQLPAGTTVSKVILTNLDAKCLDAAVASTLTGLNQISQNEIDRLFADAPEGTVLCIYALDGRLLYQGLPHIERFTSLPKGTYVLRLGNRTYKVTRAK